MKVKPLLLLMILCSATVASAEQDEYSSGITDRIHINGEGGVAFFDTEEEGEFPNNEFRVDEAKLFVEAAIIEDIYVFAEIDLLQREEADKRLQLGELYIEFEDVGSKNGLFNFRLGRFDIPFGEEYLTRDAIDNPLISHSLSDIWGVDEGIEIYGSLKTLEYAFAIQNGGEPVANDFNSDKAVVGRLLYRATSCISFQFQRDANRRSGCGGRPRLGGLVRERFPSSTRLDRNHSHHFGQSISRRWTLKLATWSCPSGRRPASLRRR